MSNSKQKGSKNERNVAKLWKDWSGYEFARTPQSGGLHWKKQHTSGDIVCIDDKHGRRFPFSIECKFHENISLLHLIDGSYGKSSIKVIDFWKQSEVDAINYGKVPLVFMRKNQMKANLHFVIMESRLLNIWLSSIGGIEECKGFLHYSDPTYNLSIINSFDLFKTDYIQFYKAGRALMKQNKSKVCQ